MGKMIKITDTTLRDAHQSLWATRMRTVDMLPVAKKIDEIGYYSLEVWGGATFDVCMRFLGEDPWERLRALKKVVTKTPLQMLLRGQNLVGYRHYPDDIVERFIHKAVENGIDIMRIFDALNDVRNLERSIIASKEAGAHVQAVVVYTRSPIHSIDHYLHTAEALVELGADSLCLKDMAGLLTPYTAQELVVRFKSEFNLPVHLHTHYIGGLAPMTYLKAIEAGVDGIDTASAPLAFGASQPPVETLVSALEGSEYSTGLDLDSLFEVALYFEKLRRERGFERGVTRISDMQVFSHQVPGGMISNLVAQLEVQKALDKLEDVLKEIPKVRADLGYPPLVTPTSQIVGIQAVLNVLCGERYKVVPDEVKAYVRGYYGRPPGEISQELIEKLGGTGEIIEGRPADHLEPIWEKMKKESAALAKSDEDVLSYALFPTIAKKFLAERNAGLIPAAEEATEEVGDLNLNELKELLALVNETDISELSLESDGIKVSIKKGGQVVTKPIEAAPSPPVAEPAVPSAPAPQPEPVEEKLGANEVQIVAPMVGTFYRAPAPDADPYVQVGDMVKIGQPLCIIEAMKLMNEIESEVEGKIKKILVENGQPVEYGQPLFIIEKA
ncbi:MAG: acetyl-CoA carboxylase biotin carboxyl carrier protein [Firmicutes bacterium]|nr:acetyl-CoA carboxylase biotin carboxyl carrier protein [Bacillota bacterium]